VASLTNKNCDLTTKQWLNIGIQRKHSHWLNNQNCIRLTDWNPKSGQNNDWNNHIYIYRLYAYKSWKGTAPEKEHHNKITITYYAICEKHFD
jgi:hypothetical protein